MDFRKGHLGLQEECRRNGLETRSGDCVVFISLFRIRVKLLVAGASGLWFGYKKFSKGTIASQLAFFADPKMKILSRSDLAMLLELNVIHSCGMLGLLFLEALMSLQLPPYSLSIHGRYQALQKLSWQLPENRLSAAAGLRSFPQSCKIGSRILKLFISDHYHLILES